MPTVTPAATHGNMLDRLMRGMYRYFYQAYTCTARWRLADCMSCLGFVVQLYALSPCFAGKTKAGGAPPYD